MEIRRESYGGRWYEIYIQDWGQDCGPTCVAMARKLLTGVGSDIDWLRKSEKRPLVSPGIQARIEALGMESRDFGSYSGDLVDLARSVGLRAKFYDLSSLALVDTLKTASRERAFIIHVEWSGGGHFVVVRHVNSAGSAIVLDPYYGLQVTSTAPIYSFSSGGGHIHGRFSGDAVEVTR